MAEKILPSDRGEDKTRYFDVVMGVSPNEWGTVTQEEKAVLALAPLLSLALILDAEKSDFSVNNADAARVLRALVDRAEVILGIPGQGVSGCVKVEVGPA